MSIFTCTVCTSTVRSCCHYSWHIASVVANSYPLALTLLLLHVCRVTWQLVCLPLLGALLVMQYSVFIGLPPFVTSAEASQARGSMATEALQAAIRAGQAAELTVRRKQMPWLPVSGTSQL